MVEGFSAAVPGFYYYNKVCWLRVTERKKPCIYSLLSSELREPSTASAWRKGEGCEAYNLGAGKGTSVLDIVHAFEKVSGKRIPLIIGPRCAGDAEILFSSTAKAERDLNWIAKYVIDKMCRDQWNWASKNPNGYRSADSIKQNGDRRYGSADSCKQNGQYGSMESVKQNGNGHLH